MTKTYPSTRIDGLFFGKVQNHWPGRDPSAIDKKPVIGRHDINELGFVEDAQADPDHHGGVEKAIHHYASEHYASWIAEGEIPAGTTPAAFGENIASRALSEDNLCIGDILQLGSAVVQISQGRQPCWKVSQYTANKKMAYLFQSTGRTGWYYRVLEPGSAGTGDMISLIERRQPDWSVRRVTAARLTRKVSQEDAETLAALPELAPGWRKAFAKIADGEKDEDTDRRLLGSVAHDNFTKVGLQHDQ
ncbi:MOSC domain-containing protein [Sulfitobacter sp. F26204]|uniref:MOSC domain-containing protein n=1 Tax=Sulfitobacter sp. F26204 TaxID=2996014 RepID=UPI00225E2939|nr:MOSC domain-containing protein [Sulfitobacter sp. F26204]MCX7561708.1 MOSC domain-containing protein [Sulfitobacter sp. F26204]